MSAFLLCAGTVRLKEEKRTEKKFRRTGFPLRHSPGGLGVAASSPLSLCLRGWCSGPANAGSEASPYSFRIRRARYKRLAGWGAARCWRFGLGSCGAAFCLVVGVGSQICREPPSRMGRATATSTGRAEPKPRNRQANPRTAVSPATGRSRAIHRSPPDCPVNRRASGAGVVGTSGLPLAPANHRAPGRGSSYTRELIRTGGQKLPGSAEP